MSLNSSIPVTGGAGFIGSNFVLQWLADRRGSFHAKHHPTVQNCLLEAV
jgi:nucleoside-diphosphate-sugar epimerase